MIGVVHQLTYVVGLNEKNSQEDTIQFATRLKSLCPVITEWYVTGTYGKAAHLHVKFGSEDLAKQFLAHPMMQGIVGKFVGAKATAPKPTPGLKKPMILKLKHGQSGKSIADLLKATNSQDEKDIAIMEVLKAVEGTPIPPELAKMPYEIQMTYVHVLHTKGPEAAKSFVKTIKKMSVFQWPNKK